MKFLPYSSLYNVLFFPKKKIKFKIFWKKNFNYTDENI
jgi:hypothetical protein